jgi:hypothetical protein
VTFDLDARLLPRRIYDALTKGTIDRAVFTPAANAYFTQEVLTDYAASLAPLDRRWLARNPCGY